MGNLPHDDHFSAEYEPVIVRLAGLGVPAVPKDYADLFRSNDFFLMRRFDTGIVPRQVRRQPGTSIEVPLTKKQKEVVQNRPVIQQNSPPSQVLLEVLRSVDPDIKSQTDLAAAYLQAEEAAIAESASDCRPAPATGLDGIFADFDDFMEARHGLDFIDLTQRTHRFGRMVVCRAVLYVNRDQPGDLSAAS